MVANIQTSMYGDKSSVKKCEISNWMAYVTIRSDNLMSHGISVGRTFGRRIKDSRRLQVAIFRVGISFMTCMEIPHITGA